ncbi:MAG: fumarylacetoacetate hydrolase family protein [Alphaproteobacteria bacterium]
MRLATLKANGRDGVLVVVDRAMRRALKAEGIAATMREAIENWAQAEPRLTALAETLEAGKAPPGAFAFDPEACAAPLPRSFAFLDGSAYLNHIELARRARGDSLPDTLESDPLMYQGCADQLLGPRDPIPGEESWGLDFEAESAVILDDVPMGVTPEEAATHIKLVMLLNDISARRLVPAELAKGFGFLHGKPPSSFSPVAATPDSLGADWDGARLHGRLVSTFNGTRFGSPDAAVDMHFSFPDLIAHAAKTRPLGAGTIIGSGTVSNADRATGSSCLLERRMIEKIETGKVTTALMKPGDRIRIEMLDANGDSVFGAIDQVVVARG